MLIVPISPGPDKLLQMIHEQPNSTEKIDIKQNVPSSKVTIKKAVLIALAAKLYSLIGFDKTIIITVELK